MSTAGFQLVAGRIPGERIATNVATSDTSTFTTTETVIDSVTAALVSGRTYRIRFYAGFATTVNDSFVIAKIREDNLTGTTLMERNTALNTTSAAGIFVVTEAEYTAVSTGNKTFVTTGQRNGGTGTLHADGAATRPRYLYVEYISG